MTAPHADEREPCPLMSIGDVAELLGTTTRTLRYYEELGLVSPSRQTMTAQRRYGAEEIERLRRIRELQTLLGLDLEEIGEQLEASDRLEGIKAEYQTGPPRERRDEILAEGLAILERLRERVSDRQGRLASFAEELDGRIGRYHAAIEQQEVGAGAG
jgi:DNA-binding transcriptional MerR regulator